MWSQSPDEDNRIVEILYYFGFEMSVNVSDYGISALVPQPPHHPIPIPTHLWFEDQLVKMQYSVCMCRARQKYVCGQTKLSVWSSVSVKVQSTRSLTGGGFHRLVG